LVPVTLTEKEREDKDPQFTVLRGTPLSEGAKDGTGPGKTDASVLAVLASEWRASAAGG